MKKFFLLLALLIPALALGLEIESGDFYDDVRPSSPEAVGINLLTRENVVQGYGNHIFGPTRAVNRAEFLKIAMLASGKQSDFEFSPERQTDVFCFTDVRVNDWFSPYVCDAQSLGIVRGYPDGKFHPERQVQYDEALKMLTLLFHYDIPETGAAMNPAPSGAGRSPSGASGSWGEPYYQAAKARGTDLPITIEFAQPLTRAHTARLAAAFLAESQGELQALRLAEAGHYGLALSSSAGSIPRSSSSSSASSDSSVSSVPSKPFYTLPPVSHFLLTGRKSDALADIVVQNPTERSFVSYIQVKVFSELRSVENLEVTLEDGTVIAVLPRRTTTDLGDYKLIYEVQLIPEKQYAIAQGQDVRFVVRANVRSIENAGFSDELVQVRTVNMTVRGETSNETKNLASLGPFPKHQTSFGRITNVTRASSASDSIVSASGTIMNVFTVAGTGASTKPLALKNLTFMLQKTGGISSSNWQLRQTGGVPIPCTLNEQAMTIFCPNLPESIGSLPYGSAPTFELTADIQVAGGATDASLQADLADSGSPERFGAIEWTDGSGIFKWVEGPTPLMRGTRWQ